MLSLFVCAASAGCSGQQGPTDRRPSPDTPVSSDVTGKAAGKAKAALMTRYEFSLAVMGKTPDGVIAAVGEPDRRSESEGRQVWSYTKRSTHPLTGEVDPSVQVLFKGGVVVDVSF
jgi:hypothetical protein